jgi:phosphomannomutase
LFIPVKASHLPEEENGLKFFAKEGGLTKRDIDGLIAVAQAEARHWYDMGIVPPSSGNAGVLCSELVTFTNNSEHYLAYLALDTCSIVTLSCFLVSSTLK